MKKELALLSLVALAACAGVNSNVATSVGSSTDPAQVVSTFVVADLQAADKTALATGDTHGAQCFEYLIPKVQALQAAQAAGKTNTAGVISAAEVTNGMTVILNNAKTGLSGACAPWVLDGITTANQLAAKFANMAAAGAAVSTGGAALVPLLAP